MGRGWWVPTTNLSPQNLIFGDLKHHAKFQNPSTTPSGKTVTRSERKKKRTNILFATSKGSAGNSLGPICQYQ